MKCSYFKFVIGIMLISQSALATTVTCSLVDYRDGRVDVKNNMKLEFSNTQTRLRIADRLFVNFISGSNPDSATKKDLLSVEFYTLKDVGGGKMMPFGPHMISSYGGEQLHVGLGMLDDPGLKFDLDCAVGDKIKY